MVNTDSVSVFEGTFEEQAQELVEYLTRTKPEAERAAFKQPFADVFRHVGDDEILKEDVDKKRAVISQVIDALDGLGEGSDREIEGFFNLIFAHLVRIYSPDAPQFIKDVTKLLDVISQQENTEQGSIKYKVLSNLFNAIPRTSPVRLVVCRTLLKLAVANDELDTLQLTTTDVDRWLSEWGSSPEEKSAFLKSVADAFQTAGQIETAFSFSLSYARSLPPAASTEPSLQLIASALRIPSIFDFDPVLKLESVQALKSNELFVLLSILNRQGLPEWSAWRERNQAILSEYKLDTVQLERKIRLLILSEIGFSKIGQNISYSEIASALQIETSEVEKWAIDVIRAGLLSGKLSQTTQTLHVVRASPRGFDVEQWTALERRLLAWKEGLSGIQNVLSTTRQSMGAALVPEQVA